MDSGGYHIELEIESEIFNARFRPHLKAPQRVQIFYGGSASGKSVFVAQRAVLDVLRGDRNYLVARNVARTLRSSAFNEICKAIAQFRLSDFFLINKSDMVITCGLNGRQILFVGLDDVEKVKSITPAKGVITDIWVEEATETSRDDVKQLDKRLRGRSRVTKRLTMSFNPILQSHWIYAEYFAGVWTDDQDQYQDDGLLILKTTYRDNAFLEPDDIAALENESDPYFYNVYTLGNWGVLGDVIFRNWRVEDLSDRREQLNNYRNGLDFGFGGHPAAMVHTHYDAGKKTIYILSELYEYEMTNDVLAAAVREVIGEQMVTCDSAEPKSIREMQNCAVRARGARKGKDSVNFGVQWLQQQQIVMDLRCQYMRNELQRYQWKKNAAGETLPVPVDRDNHLIDALRYAYEDDMISRRIKTMTSKDRARLGL